jgi:hypothetical protein
LLVIAAGAVGLLAWTGVIGGRAPTAAPVLGTFPSEHLALSFRPMGLWLHAPERDRRDALPSGWERRSSVLYRGASADRHDAQLYVAVFAHGAQAATIDDARRLGNAELAPSTTARDCREHPAGTLTVYGCSATVQGPLGPTPAFEGYVVWGARVLFVRHVAQPISADAPGPEVEALTVFATVAPHR